VDDRITLSLVTGDKELQKAIGEYKEVIMAETLANELTTKSYTYEVEVAIEDTQLSVHLDKA